MLWTSKSTKTDHSIETANFGKPEIESERDPLENVWNMFVDAPTMVAGLYMLPRSLNGASTLRHEMDEISYIVNGTAKFRMIDTVVEVQPGSVMWVKRGVGH